MRDFAEGALAPVAEELDREGRFPVELVEQAAGLGLLGIPLDEEWGGAGAGTVSYALAIEELARVDSSFAITVAAHTSLGTQPIAMFGSDEQRQRWLPELASGRGLAVVRADRAGRGLGRRGDPNDGPPRGRRVGDRRHQDVHHQRRHAAVASRHHHRPHRRGRGLEHRRRERHAGLRAVGTAEEDGLAVVGHA